MLFLRQLRIALRNIGKSWAFFALAIATLALGIGAATIVFSVTNSILWRPLPFPQPQRLVKLSERNPRRPWQSGVSGPNFLDWRARSHSFENLTLWDWGSGRTLTGPEMTERVRAGAVSGGFFETLGVTLAFGRTIRADDDKAAVLGHELWQRQFHGDRSVLGTAVKLDGDAYTIVGVLPARFKLDFVDDPDLYIPLLFRGDVGDRGSKHLSAIGRIKVGTTLRQADAEMAAVAAALAAEHPDTNANASVSLENLREAFTKFNEEKLRVFLGFGGFVLLIACANVASLLLVRFTGRRRENELRMALGASRAALVQQALAENTWIALPAGAGGAILAAWGIAGARKFLPPDTFARAAGISMDWTALLFVLAVSSLTLFAFSVVPTLLSAQFDTESTLRDWGKSAAGNPRTQRRIASLIAMELTLAFVMLFGAGLFLSSYQYLEEVPLGFDPHGVLTMRVLPGSNFRSAQERAAFFERALEKAAGVPGVRQAALASAVPLVGSGVVFFERADRPRPARGNELDSLARVVSPAYFRVMNIALIRGRAFTKQDTITSPRVALINQTLAARVFGTADPIGKELEIFRGGDSAVPAGKVQIVGIASNTKELGLDEVVLNDLYLPSAQNPARAMYVVANVDQRAGGIVAAMRRELQTLDPEEAIYSIATMEERLSDSLRGARFNLAWIALFAAFAVILASVGVYGAIAFSVALRTQEFGVRMALGAPPRAILSLAFSESARLAVTGAAGGLALALVLGELLKGALYLAPGKHVAMISGVSVHDPASLVAAGLAMVGLAALAAFTPARRASHVDPLAALRHQ